MENKLAIFGGQKAVQLDEEDMFSWPITTSEDEEAVLEVLRKGSMSGTDVTVQFEKEFSKWQGSKYALGFNNGTSALHGAMSLMSGKSFPIGEGGILVTDDIEIYERAIVLGHYERFGDNIQTEGLKPYINLPLNPTIYINN